MLLSEGYLVSSLYKSALEHNLIVPGTPQLATTAGFTAFKLREGMNCWSSGTHKIDWTVLR